MVQQEELCALVTNVPWVSWPDSGPQRQTNDAWTTSQQKDAKVIFQANKRVYDSQCTVQHVIVNGLNIAVPRQYKRDGGNAIGVKIYQPTDYPKTIINNMQTNY